MNLLFVKSGIGDAERVDVKRSANNDMRWKVHLPALLAELIEGNPAGGIMVQPIRILRALLAEVGKRAAELNDPKLNDLMCRLAIYSIADPEDPNFDPVAVENVRKAAQK